jgi:hypothetical protein
MPFNKSQFIKHESPQSWVGGFLFFVTCYDKKNDFLLIEVFRKLFNPQNDGHLDQLWVAFYYLSGYLRISHFSQSDHPKTM